MISVMRFFGFLYFFLFVFLQNSLAQAPNTARSYMELKEWSNAVLKFKKMNASELLQEENYQDYLICLTNTKDYKSAAQLIQQKIKLQPNKPNYYIDLGNIYALQNQKNKADEQFENTIKFITGDDLITQQIANQFELINQPLWAIKIYEHATTIANMGNLYARPLSRLYNATGQTATAIKTLISGQQNGYQIHGDENLESNLLELIGTDKEKQKLAQQTIFKQLTEQPDNYLLTNLFIWISSIQNNWDQALIQATALEKRSNDKGAFTLKVAQHARMQQNYEVASTALQKIIQMQSETKYHQKALEALSELLLDQLNFEKTLNKKISDQLSQVYLQLFEQYPQAIQQPIAQQFASYLALNLQNTDSAITILKKTIANNPNLHTVGNAKLQLGDYYIVSGDIWEAALIYSQVDKAFKQDILGEEARFRNAKLSYYRHDFDQAQGQLSVLKASTSELIANDALYLSVLITENTPTDSNYKPLQQFATADLLLFQHQLHKAEILLDSILIEHPKNPLIDDILYLKSKIELERKDFTKAINYLERIINEHGSDVLADDALFQIASIYQYQIKEPNKASTYYEQLITKHPGSSFIHQARQQLKSLQPVAL
jgi:tetratricopeptide (TPR) repeat protein